MCGIAGAIDLTGSRTFPRERLLAMTTAIAHRGPDDEQVHIEPGVALANRRLAIIDLEGGRQPLANEDGNIWVAFEGELYDHPELFEKLSAKGHTFSTRCDTEVWVHLYEEQGAGVFREALGQFSVSLWDRTNRTLYLARDRVGIGPLFYTLQDGWLLWSSEIKGLLASGLVDAQPDPCGLDYLFNFFAYSTVRTCFEGIHSLPPGHYLKVHDGGVTLEQYWDLDFPDHGEERRYSDLEQPAAELEDLLRGAVRRRLVSEVPVSCYISGGLDSTVILGLCSQERGTPIPSFTIGLENSGPADERAKAAEAAGFVDSPLTTVNVTQADIASIYPDLVTASEGPVIDTSCACMMLLAAANRGAGRVVALTGEGADEALAGYVWFKWHRMQAFFNRFGLGGALPNRLISLLVGGGRSHRPHCKATGGIRTAQQLSWELMAQTRERLFSPEMWQRLGDHSSYVDVPMPHRARRWHPLNQSLYAAYKVLLPGLLLTSKGDRPLRHSSTEGRYPFLDERVVDFCAGIAPEYKLRGRTDKWLLRRVAERVLPQQIANRKKTMFRASLSSSFLQHASPPWVEQLLSPESLARTGYFNPAGIDYARRVQARKGRVSVRRFAYDMGLVGVISTQLWHHLFLGGGLCDLPAWTPPAAVSRDAPVKVS